MIFLNANAGLIHELLQLPIFHAEWVLWLLFVLSVASVATMLERQRFYVRHRVDVREVERLLNDALDDRDAHDALRRMQEMDAMETRVLLSGLHGLGKGADSVEELLAGALGAEKLRYEGPIDFLATVASNAPFVGLFGTVLGVIHSFNDLSHDIRNASAAVMAGIAESLVATAVGLFVAIPAIVAYNYFKRQIRVSAQRTDQLTRVLLSHLKRMDVPVVVPSSDAHKTREA
ncbi:MAG: MotA/TolQ/ExbB proton channel family protein [Polyangiales bacterium]